MLLIVLVTSLWSRFFAPGNSPSAPMGTNHTVLAFLIVEYINCRRMKAAFIIILALLPASLLAAGTAGPPGDFFEELEDVPKVNFVSTNWLNAVKVALPAQYWTNADLTLEQLTNLLCQQSQKHNVAAEDLWALVLLSRGGSTEESQAAVRLLQDSANQGFAPAMANLGICYENGKCIPVNYDQAFHWFSLAAAAGNAEGELQLGACYHYGLGTVPDLKKMVKYYRLAAMQTNYTAMKSLGYVMMNGIGTARDPEMAKYWFTRAAKEGGNRRAMYDLGVYYQTKSPDTNAMNEAFYWYRRSAELGDPLACYALAECYLVGWGTEMNADSYRLWTFRAATLGATQAQDVMGRAYQYGNGVPTNMDTALIWYRKAAAKEHPDALYQLAIYYFRNIEHGSFNLAKEYMVRAARAGNLDAQYQCALIDFHGDVGPLDFEEGKQWLADSASHGWAPAEFLLFQLYYNGYPPAPGCPNYPLDKIEGIKWLRRAADHGFLQAQSVLAVMLVRGTDMEPNTVEAAKLLRNAAQRGYVQAQNDLGFAIMHGDLGITDMVQAAMWLELAKARWPDPKTERRVDVNLSNALAQLTPDQQQEVAQQVKGFQPLPLPNLDPLLKDWDKNPDYQQEDGQFGH
jgi:TPR repeat protein